MEKEKLIQLLRKAYLSGIMEKELSDKMQGFNYDLEGMATSYAEIEVNNVVSDNTSNCELEGLDEFTKQELDKTRIPKLKDRK